MPPARHDKFALLMSNPKIPLVQVFQAEARWATDVQRILGSARHYRSVAG